MACDLQVTFKGNQMQMFFCIEEDIINPETREVVLLKHGTYSQFEIDAKRVEFGFDSFKATVLFAESFESACVMAMIT
jgi:hypothetical protein